MQSNQMTQLYVQIDAKKISQPIHKNICQKYNESYDEKNDKSMDGPNKYLKKNYINEYFTKNLNLNADGRNNSKIIIKWNKNLTRNKQKKPQQSATKHYQLKNLIGTGLIKVTDNCQFEVKTILFKTKRQLGSTTVKRTESYYLHDNSENCLRKMFKKNKEL